MRAGIAPQVDSLGPGPVVGLPIPHPRPHFNPDNPESTLLPVEPYDQPTAKPTSEGTMGIDPGDWHSTNPMDINALLLALQSHGQSSIGKL